MTRGTQATAISPEVRATRSALIRQSKSEQGKMPCVAGNRGDTRYAQSERYTQANHRTARDLTPGPKGSGED